MHSFLKLLGVLASVPIAMLCVIMLRDAIQPRHMDILAHFRGSLISQAPFQHDLSHVPYDFQIDETRLSPQATFEITGVVLAKNRYLLPWEKMPVAPLSLSLGWGTLSDPGVYGAFRFSHHGRSMSVSHNAPGYIDQRVVDLQSANMQIIPATDAVRKQISSIRVGNMVRLSGFLVDINAGGKIIETSTIRTDTGLGSDEILYVQIVDLSPV